MGNAEVDDADAQREHRIDDRGEDARQPYLGIPEQERQVDRHHQASSDERAPERFLPTFCTPDQDDVEGEKKPGDLFTGQR